MYNTISISHSSYFIRNKQVLQKSLGTSISDTTLVIQNRKARLYLISDKYVCLLSYVYNVFYLTVFFPHTIKTFSKLFTRFVDTRLPICSCLLCDYGGTFSSPSSLLIFKMNKPLVDWGYPKVLKPCIDIQIRSRVIIKMKIYKPVFFLFSL